MYAVRSLIHQSQKVVGGSVPNNVILLIVGNDRAVFLNRLKKH